MSSWPHSTASVTHSHSRKTNAISYYATVSPAVAWKLGFMRSHTVQLDDSNDTSTRRTDDDSHRDEVPLTCGRSSLRQVSIMTIHETRRLIWPPVISYCHLTAAVNMISTVIVEVTRNKQWTIALTARLTSFVVYVSLSSFSLFFRFGDTSSGDT